MTAEEMFEELGYIKSIDRETIKDTLIHYDNGINRVTFNVDKKYNSNILFDFNKINIDKLNNAINKQIEELKWED